MTTLVLVVLPQVFAWIGMISIATTAIGLGVLAYWIKRGGIPTEVELEPQRASVWHDASEKPALHKKFLACNKVGFMWAYRLYNNTVDKWGKIVNRDGMVKWAYMDDLRKLK